MYQNSFMFKSVVGRAERQRWKKLFIFKSIDIKSKVIQVTSNIQKSVLHQFRRGDGGGEIHLSILKKVVSSHNASHSPQIDPEKRLKFGT